MESLQEGTLLKGGEYLIKGVLGQGGFGITYLARQVLLKRDVAIKEFYMNGHCMREAETGRVKVPPTGSAVQVEKYRKKFLSEARTLALLEHPHIVSVFDVWEGNGTVYFSMPYMAGGSLKELVHRCGRLPETTALRYVSQVAEALIFMHQDCHQCHYDVKPANIMLDSNGDVKLIDFGISKNYDAQGNEMSHTPIGWSEGYSPLEQIGKVTEFSPSIDVYALGATLYFLVTGKTPPLAADLAQKTAKLEFDQNVSSKTRNLIVSAMRPSAKKRPKDVDVFIQSQSVRKPVIMPVQERAQKTPAEAPVIVYPAESGSVQLGQQSQLLTQPQKTEPFSKALPKKTKYILPAVLALAVIICFASVVVGPLIIHDESVSKETGIADSLLQVGRNYYYGKSGFPKDFIEAVNHFRQAADMGNAEAQNCMGNCRYYGDGIKQSYTEAANWYRKAADQGYARAQNNLGECYYDGKGVEKNFTEAMRWYSKAADQDFARAQNNLGICYYNGEGVKRDVAEAVKWFRKAAEQGNVDAQLYMGLCYKDGKGVKRDETKAVEWFFKAADQNDPQAQRYLGYCHEEGKGVEKNSSEAIKWYRKAAKQNDSEAKLGLKRMGVSD